MWYHWDRTHSAHESYYVEVTLSCWDRTHSAHVISHGGVLRGGHTCVGTHINESCRTCECEEEWVLSHYERVISSHGGVFVFCLIMKESYHVLSHYERVISCSVSLLKSHIITVSLWKSHIITWRRIMFRSHIWGHTYRWGMLHMWMWRGTSHVLLWKGHMNEACHNRMWRGLIMRHDSCLIMRPLHYETSSHSIVTCLIHMRSHNETWLVPNRMWRGLIMRHDSQ